MNWCKECDFAQWEINPRTLVPELWCAAQVAQISPNNDACEDFVSTNERKQVITHSPKIQCMQSQHCTFCNGATALEMKLDNGTTVAVTYQVPIKSLVKRMVLWPLTTRVPFAEQELPFDNQPKRGREYEDGFTTANGVRGKIVITIPGKFTVSDVLSVHKQVTKAVQRITDKEIKW